MKKYLVIAILSLTSIVSLSAQEEIVYNQYHFNYYLANPALAGAEPCSHFMLTNKFQWVGMDEFPMIQTLSFRTRALDRIGIGAFLYNDRNGYSNRIGGQATFAYHIPLSDGRRYRQNVSLDRQLSFGVSFKLNYFSINQELLDDPSTQGDNAFANPDGLSPNANFGVYFKSYGFFTGLSLTNLIPTTPDIFGDKEVPAPFTGFFFLGNAFELDYDAFIEPSIMVKANQYGNIGGDINLKFGQEVDRDFGYWLQASYRQSFDRDNGQSLMLMPMGGVRFGKFQLGYSFSLDLNNLVTHSYGSHEIMLGYSFCIPKYFCR